MQHSSGFWPETCIGDIQAFFKADVNSSNISEKKLLSLEILNDSEIDKAWMTILALFILENVFGDREDEWLMIAQKAKTYLASIGLQKAATVCDQITLELDEES